MARKKGKGTELSVFKGREARLNRAITQTLDNENRKVIYDLTKLIRKQQGFKRTKYTNVSRRVKALEQQRFLERAGSRNLQAGGQGALYQPTTRAHVAFFLNNFNPDTFINEAEEDTLLTALAALLLFFKQTAEKRNNAKLNLSADSRN